MECKEVEQRSGSLVPADDILDRLGLEGRLGFDSSLSVSSFSAACADVAFVESGDGADVAEASVAANAKEGGNLADFRFVGDFAGEWAKSL